MLRRKYALAPIAALVGTLMLGACSSSSDSDDDTPDDLADIEDPLDVADGDDTDDIADGDDTDDVDPPTTTPPSTPTADGLVETTIFGGVFFSQLDPSLPPPLDGSIVFAEFGVADEPQPLAEIDDILFVTSELCEVTTSDDFDDIEDSPFDTVSAGDNIVISSPAGTFVTLVPELDDGDLAYDVEDGATVPSPLPSGLTVDIPGDVFPAFSNVAVPDVDPLTGVETSGPDNMSVSWNPGSNDGPILAISVIDITSGAGATCFTADDGEFSFPADVQAELDADFTASAISLIRLDNNIVSQGDVVLSVSNNSVANAGLVSFNGSVTPAETALLRATSETAMRAVTSR